MSSSSSLPLHTHPTTIHRPPTTSLHHHHNLHFYHRHHHHRNLHISASTQDSASISPEPPRRPNKLINTLAASTVILLGFGIRTGSVAANPERVLSVASQDCEVQSVQGKEDFGKCETAENHEAEELRAAFESWKSKTYALTVPLRIVALRNSVPPLWIKNFLQSQGRRVKFRIENRGNLEAIFSELSVPYNNGNVTPRSIVAADLVSLGGTWVSSAIRSSLIQPLDGVEDQDWFRDLTDKWKIYLHRNTEGKIDSEGRVWAAPYRWGSMVIAYRKSKFQRHNLVPIEDWADLWRPELSGKISMVDCPREVIGAVLKFMGASYNTSNIDSQVTGGRAAVHDKLATLVKQVRLFDSGNYLKSFSVGDVWVAVGWSSDILPAAKRMSDVAVIVPKSGSSLWADFWAIPAASDIATDKLGGRVRGPSPLVHQWIEFCLQAERALPFEEIIVPGSSPSALGGAKVNKSEDVAKNKPKLDTNLVAGVPPADILSKCEFLEPLSDSALLDYQWLINTMQKPRIGFFQNLQLSLFSMIQIFQQKIAA